MHALFLLFLAGLPNDFLDAVSYPEAVDNSIEGIFFLLDGTANEGYHPSLASGILEEVGDLGSNLVYLDIDLWICLTALALPITRRIAWQTWLAFNPVASRTAL
jgi:hypothetical protein